MKKIILISGKARSGKDYCAELLKNKLEKEGYKVVIDRFAKYIKSYLKDYYGWNGVKDEEYRHKLQWLGTERIKQDLNFKSFHAKRLAEDFQIFENEFDYFIVPDTRFPDEIYTMLSAFGKDKVITIRVNRIDKDVTKDLGELSKHSSEVALDDFKFDYMITNNGDESFERAVDDLIIGVTHTRDFSHELVTPYRNIIQ